MVVFECGHGVFGEDDDDEEGGREESRLSVGAAPYSNGEGSNPAPKWKLLQLIHLKFLDGDDPNQAGPSGFTLLQ